MYKAVIFDLEGVLIYHKKRQAALIEHACKENKVELKFRVEPMYWIRSNPKFHPAEGFIAEIMRRNKTKPNKKLVKSIVASYKTLRRKPKFLADLQRRVPGSIETLKLLKKKKIKLALITSANKKHASFLLRHFGLKKYFKIVLDDSCGLPAKPHPARINAVLEEFKLCPKEVLFVEDNVATILGGKRAGLDTCAVLTGTAKKNDMKKAKPTYIFKSVKEMKVIFDE